MELSGQQQQAMAIAADFVHMGVPEGQSPILRIDGYAGTGKTTIANMLADGVSGGVIFAAYTGKAAGVLSRKIGRPASTIHSLIYTPKDKCQARLDDLLQQSQQYETRAVYGEVSLTDEAYLKIREQMKEEADNLRRPSFALNLESDVRDAALLVVDEHSMVGRDVGDDIASFKVPVLALGDPFQLQPVAGQPWLSHIPAAITLTEVHRQAEGSPIIWMATRVRSGSTVPPGEYGDGCVSKGSATDDDISRADVVLCGRNKTRRIFNKRARALLGLSGDLPVEGDKLVCLQNNNERGLQNGTLWRVMETDLIGGPAGRLIILTLKSEDDGYVVTTRVHRSLFTDPDAVLSPSDRRAADSFDFGYALTVHKSQGSQWDRVLLIDEGRMFPGEEANWLYTGITRAARQITIVRG